MPPPDLLPPNSKPRLGMAAAAGREAWAGGRERDWELGRGRERRARERERVCSCARASACVCFSRNQSRESRMASGPDPVPTPSRPRPDSDHVPITSRSPPTVTPDVEFSGCSRGPGPPRRRPLRRPGDPAARADSEPQTGRTSPGRGVRGRVPFGADRLGAIARPDLKSRRRRRPGPGGRQTTVALPVSAPSRAREDSLSDLAAARLGLGLPHSASGSESI